MLDNRLIVLRLVLEGGVHELQEHMKSIKTGIAGVKQAATQTKASSASSDNSRNAGELVSVGPCVNYEKLITLDELKAENAGFHNVE